jgi:predicted nuclease of predicted toxin-antitoxin system
VKLKLDENLGRAALAQCQASGHDTSSIHLQNMAGSADTTVNEVCRVELRTLVTLDLDFANPLVFDPRGSAGCAVLRLPRNAGPSDIRDALKSFLDGLQHHDISGQLCVVRLDRIRIWKAPEAAG